MFKKIFSKKDSGTKASKNDLNSNKNNDDLGLFFNLFFFFLFLLIVLYLITSDNLPVMFNFHQKKKQRTFSVFFVFCQYLFLTEILQRNNDNFKSSFFSKNLLNYLNILLSQKCNVFFPPNNQFRFISILNQIGNRITEY
jgi:hypothetical protein